MQVITKSNLPDKLVKARLKRKSNRNAKIGNFSKRKTDAISDMFAEKPKGYAVNIAGRAYYVLDGTHYRLED